MKIEHSDAHTVDVLDDAGMAFMALTVHRLNQALKSQGISDASLRQEICGSFLFEFAYQHDAGWMVSNDRKFFPKVAFVVRKAPGPDQNLGEVEQLHLPTEASSWHEYAHGVVSQYFEDDDESVPGVQTGSYEMND